MSKERRTELEFYLRKYLARSFRRDDFLFPERTPSRTDISDFAGFNGDVVRRVLNCQGGFFALSDGRDSNGGYGRTIRSWSNLLYLREGKRPPTLLGTSLFFRGHSFFHYMVEESSDDSKVLVFKFSRTPTVKDKPDYLRTCRVEISDSLTPEETYYHILEKLS